MTTTVMRVRTDHVFGRRQLRASSNTTGNPSPPRMTAAAMGRLIHGSPANPMRLSR